MPRTLYAIKDWATWFEKNHKDTEVMFRWVALPTRHDGKGYRRLARHPRACDLFTAFVLMVEVAAKMPTRGVLADEDGPLDADDLADATGFAADIFKLAFRVLSEPAQRITWLEVVSSSDKFGQLPPTEQNSTEQENTARAAHAFCTEPEIPASVHPETAGAERRASHDEPPAKPLLTYPIVGRGLKTWVLTEECRADLSSAYPTTDVLAESRKALAWIQANPERRKTGKGMRRFLTNWLNRATDRRGGIGAAGGGFAPHAEDLDPADAAMIEDRARMRERTVSR